jgi:O-antigen ligase
MAYLSYFWSMDKEYALSVYNKYKYYWVIIPVFFTSLNKNEVKNNIYVLTFSLGVYALFTILIYLGIFTIGTSTVNNPKGIYNYSVSTPLMAIGTLCSAVIINYVSNNQLKIIFSIVFFLCLFSFVINNGRAAQISFILTIFTIMILYIRTINFKIFVSSIIGIILVVLLLNSFGKLDRLKSGVDNIIHVYKSSSFNDAGSWGQRAFLYYAGYNIFLDKPIIGVGAGDIPQTLETFSKDYPQSVSWLRNFHNFHLEILVKYGLIGYLFFWIPIFLLLYSLQREKFFFQIAIVFFVFSFYNSFFDDLLTMKPYNNIFVTIFIMLLYITTINLRKGKSK